MHHCRMKLAKPYQAGRQLLGRLGMSARACLQELVGWLKLGACCHSLLPSRQAGRGCCKGLAPWEPVRFILLQDACMSLAGERRCKKGWPYDVDSLATFQSVFPWFARLKRLPLRIKGWMPALVGYLFESGCRPVAKFGHVKVLIAVPRGSPSRQPVVLVLRHAGGSTGRALNGVCEVCCAGFNEHRALDGWAPALAATAAEFVSRFLTWQTIHKLGDIQSVDQIKVTIRAQVFVLSSRCSQSAACSLPHICFDEPACTQLQPPILKRIAVLPSSVLSSPCVLKYGVPTR